MVEEALDGELGAVDVALDQEARGDAVAFEDRRHPGGGGAEGDRVVGPEDPPARRAGDGLDHAGEGQGPAVAGEGPLEGGGTVEGGKRRHRHRGVGEAPALGGLVPGRPGGAEGVVGAAEGGGDRGPGDHRLLVHGDHRVDRDRRREAPGGPGGGLGIVEGQAQVGPGGQVDGAARRGGGHRDLEAKGPRGGEEVRGPVGLRGDQEEHAHGPGGA